MKRWFLLCWLILPLPLIVWHYGPGQQWLARDRADTLIRKAREAEANANWAEAQHLFQAAAAQIGNRDPQTRLRLDIALVRMRYRQGAALDAIDGAARILTNPTLETQPAALQQEARELAGRIHYYAAWIMRLEGAQRDLWLEEAERARQNYRLLTESALATQAVEQSARHQTNLESAVRLQRMSLIELMARPLPEEARGMAGQGLSEQMARRRGQRGNQPGIGPNDEGPPADGAGTTRFPGGPGS